MFKAFQEASLSVLERVFWLMSADSSEEEVQAVQRALPSSDPTERANAAEAMEATLPPVVARQLVRLLDGSPSEEVIACAENELGMRPPSLMQVLQNAWLQLNAQNTRPAIPQRLQKFYADGWLTTTAIYLLTETTVAVHSAPVPARSLVANAQSRCPPQCAGCRKVGIIASWIQIQRKLPCHPPNPSR